MGIDTISRPMEDNKKFQEAQQQIGTLYQAAQSALLPARDHQVVTDSARALATFLQALEKDCSKDCGITPAEPIQESV
jgi:hypothetical protein